MAELGVHHAENEMEPRAVARYRISRDRRWTSLSEPVRQVVAAWIVAVFVVVAGLSVLAFHFGGRDGGAAAVALRWHSPPVARAEESDEPLCCSGIRACASESPAERDCDDWTITQSLGSSGFMCSYDDHGRAEEGRSPCRRDL